ncbi:MAG: cytidylate kinase-like family protein [Lachnospiraceae bacterium]|nr:cytidylate kinase-like family protein [Lachnospiraceae bacterium]
MYHILAMERQFATGGNEIGRRVAKELGIPLYDRNILIEAAKLLDLQTKYIEDLEETAPGSLIFNLSAKIGGALNSSNKAPLSESNLPLSVKLFMEEKRIIEAKAAEGDCVIIGRCASDIFRSRNDCLKVFIFADKDFRMNRTIETEKFPKEQAEDRIKKMDKKRSDFFRTHTNKEWMDMSNYDICINSGLIGMDKAVDMLVSLMRE